MYSYFRQSGERLLRIPPDPQPPPGDESSTRLFRAAPNFYKYLLFLWGLKTLLAAFICCWLIVGPVAAFIDLTRRGKPWAFLLLAIPVVMVGLVAAARLFALAVLRLDFEKRWYVVTDRSLRVREGIIAVREMTVTFANIQNIAISQGPVQRLLGIADLRVETAGGGAAQHDKHAPQDLHTAKFRGIDNAHEVHELIQRRLRVLKDSGLGDHEEIQALRAGRSVIHDATFIDALRQVQQEARALRECAEAAVRPGAS